MPFAAYAGGAGAVPAVLGLRFFMRRMRDEAPTGCPLQGRRGSFLLCILQMAGCGCILWEKFEQT